MMLLVACLYNQFVCCMYYNHFCFELNVVSNKTMFIVWLILHHPCTYKGTKKDFVQYVAVNLQDWYFD